MNKYLAIIKASYQVVMASHLQIVIINLQAVFTLFVLFSFWQSVFRHQTLVRGYTFPEIVTYYFLMRVTYNRISAFRAAKIAKDIKSGEITNFLLRPYNYILMNVFQYITFTTLWTAGNFLAILAFSIYLYGFLVGPASYNYFLLFVLVFVVNGFLISLINICIGCLAFWIGEVTHLKIVSTIIINILSGGLVPLAFFPDWFLTVSNFLPFKYLIQFPSDIYFGRLGLNNSLLGIVTLTLWVIIIYLFANFLLRRGLRIYESYN